MRNFRLAAVVLGVAAGVIALLLARSGTLVAADLTRGEQGGALWLYSLIIIVGAGLTYYWLLLANVTLLGAAVWLSALPSATMTLVTLLPLGLALASWAVATSLYQQETAVDEKVVVHEQHPSDAR